MLITILLPSKINKNMTLTQRYSNDTMVRNYIRIHDPGHSWLEVPVKDVRDIAGVWDNITTYSPLKRHKFYLEEPREFLKSRFANLQREPGFQGRTNKNLNLFSQ